MGKPVLIALIAGKSAYEVENLPNNQILERVMKVLRKVFIYNFL